MFYTLYGKNKMKRENNRMIILGLILIILICLCFITNTYSKYLSSAKSSSTTKIASWVIKVNDIDITGGENLEDNKLLELQPDLSNKVAKGTIAPGTTASGTIVIDPTGTEVELKYTIKLGTPSYTGTETPPNITITGVKLGDVTLDLIDVEENETNKKVGTKIIELPGADDNKIAMTEDQKQILTVTATWNSTNDADDTVVGIEGETITVPVEIIVEQNI